MKTLFIALLALVSLNSFSQPWEKIQGNGNLKKETRNVSGYTAIASAGSWDVMVAYGSSNSIEVEADENLLTYLETVVKDGTLKIKTKDRINISSHRKITVYVTLTRLTGVSLAGSGDIIGDGNFENSGTTKIKLAGSGNVKLNFEKMDAIDISIAGSGNVKLNGTANSIKTSIAGSGDVNCEGVIADNLSASIAGSGTVRATANKSVTASISGSGDVYFKGTATDIRKSVSGSGRVKQM